MNDDISPTLRKKIKNTLAAALNKRISKLNVYTRACAHVLADHPDLRLNADEVEAVLHAQGWIKTPREKTIQSLNELNRLGLATRYNSNRPNTQWQIDKEFQL